MSLSRTPTLPYALPLYELMQGRLGDAIKSSKEASIAVAAAAGLEKLMQYYDKALVNDSNIIATGEHYLYVE